MNTTPLIDPIEQWLFNFKYKRAAPYWNSQSRALHPLCAPTSNRLGDCFFLFIHAHGA
jgi:hypothetical protein